MSKIFCTGDLHGNPRRFGTHEWPEGKTLNKDDFVVILGDFGCLWCTSENDPHWKEEVYWLNWLSDKPWTSVFVDGNHESFARLDNLEQVEMFGGTVGVVRDSILHLKRGEIYEIADKKFFVMGGALSVDKHRRIPNVSWWEREQPSKKEQDHGISNLIANDMKVDYILTHTCPQHIVSIMLGGEPTSLYAGNYYDKFYDPLTKYLSYIYESVQFDKWFFGHFHEDRKIDDKFMCLYKGIYRLI